jgi:hypothetical protein
MNQAKKFNAEEAYKVAHILAKNQARESGCGCYILAVVSVVQGVPMVTGFTLSDWHDSAAVARVDVSASGAITVNEV